MWQAGVRRGAAGGCIRRQHSIDATHVGILSFNYEGGQYISECIRSAVFTGIIYQNVLFQ